MMKEFLATSVPEATMGMKCHQLHFLSLGIRGRVASPLPRCLIFTLTIYGRIFIIAKLAMVAGRAEISKQISALEGTT